MFSINQQALAGQKNSYYISLNQDLINTNIPDVATLQSIIDQYDEIETLTEFEDFYNQYVLPFENNGDIQNNIVYDLQSIETVLASENVQLLDYIKEKLVDSSHTQIKNLFNQIFESLRLVEEISFQKYFKYFEGFLPRIRLSSSTNTVYKILYFIKPYHTEIMDIGDIHMVISRDKFNNIYFDHSRLDIGDLQKDASVIDLESICCNTSGYREWYDTLNIVSASNADYMEFSPVISLTPELSGGGSVGDTVLCSTGSWYTYPSTLVYTYQWQLDDVDVTDETDSSYIILVGDIGKTLKCVVTATNTSGSKSEDSDEILVT